MKNIKSYYIFFLLSCFVIEPMLKIQFGVYERAIGNGLPFMLYFLFIINLIIAILFTKIIFNKVTIFSTLIFLLIFVIMFFFNGACFSNNIEYRSQFRNIDIDSITFLNYFNYYILSAIQLIIYLICWNFRSQMSYTILKCICISLSFSVIFNLINFYYNQILPFHLNTDRLKFYTDIILLLYSLSKYKELKIKEGENNLTLQAPL